MKYIKTHNSKGRWFLLGPYSTSGEAMKVLDSQNIPSDSEMVDFATSDIRRATRQMKASAIMHHNIDEATSRVGHKFDMLVENT